MVRVKHDMHRPKNFTTIFTVKLRSSFGMCFGVKVNKILFKGRKKRTTKTKTNINTT